MGAVCTTAGAAREHHSVGRPEPMPPMSRLVVGPSIGVVVVHVDVVHRVSGLG
jgi:hypothetical protein